MMTTSLQSFQYLTHNVRLIIDEDGALWWVARDVARVLALRNVRRLLAQFPEDEKGVRNAYTLGGHQRVNTVNEAGLYRLIFTARTEEAEMFKRWVFREVLPAIRRDGFYTTVEALREDIRALHAKHAETLAVLAHQQRLVKDTRDYWGQEAAYWMTMCLPGAPRHGRVQNPLIAAKAAKSLLQGEPR